MCNTEIKKDLTAESASLILHQAEKAKLQYNSC